MTPNRKARTRSPRGLECHAEGDRASIMDRGRAGSDSRRLTFLKLSLAVAQKGGKVGTARHRPRSEKQKLLWTWREMKRA